VFEILKNFDIVLFSLGIWDSGESAAFRDRGPHQMVFRINSNLKNQNIYLELSRITQWQQEDTSGDWIQNARWLEEIRKLLLRMNTLEN